MSACPLMMDEAGCCRRVVGAASAQGVELWWVYLRRRVQVEQCLRSKMRWMRWDAARRRRNAEQYEGPERSPASCEVDASTGKTGH